MGSQLMSRRSVLEIGGTVVLAAVTASRTAAQAAARRIDVHHHYFAPTWMAKRRSQIQASNGARFGSWTPQYAIEAMDEAGCALAIVSCGGPGTWDRADSIQGNRTVAREVNEFGARMAGDHRGRFGFFASVGLPDIDGSLKEIDYALHTLKADGVLLWSNFDGRFLGDPGFAPVFDELNRRRAVVFVHPKVTSDFNDAADPLRAIGINWQNTTRTISSLLEAGTLARCRDVTFVFAHGGGLLPVVATRLAGTRPWVSYSPEKLALLKNLYVDTASIIGNAGAWGALRAFAEPSRVLFGSDFPYVEHEIGDGLKHVVLSAEETAAIERHNAESLLFGRVPRS